MGQDKAFLPFQGVPMIELAVQRLKLTCDEVGILGNDPALARFGEVVPDEMAECGPLSGIVQALRAARHDWVLITPVDLPLLPGGLLNGWARKLLGGEEGRFAVCCLSDMGQAHPLVCLLHRSIGRYLADALKNGERKVLPLLRSAGEAHGGFRMIEIDDPWWREVWTPTPGEAALRDLWFGNANTPEELATMELRAEMCQ